MEFSNAFKLSQIKQNSLLLHRELIQVFGPRIVEFNVVD